MEWLQPRTELLGVVPEIFHATCAHKTSEGEPCHAMLTVDTSLFEGIAFMKITPDERAPQNYSIHLSRSQVDLLIAHLEKIKKVFENIEEVL